LGDSLCQNANGREVLAPPIFRQQAVKVCELSGRAHSFGVLVIHRAQQTRWSPPVSGSARINGLWLNQQSAPFTALFESELQVRRRGLSLYGEIRRDARSLKRKFLQTSQLRRWRFKQLQV